MRLKTALALALLATLTSGCVVKFEQTEQGVRPRLTAFMTVVKNWEASVKPVKATIGGCDIDRAGLGTDTAYKDVAFTFELKGVKGRADGRGQGTFSLAHPIYGTFKGTVSRVQCVGEARTFLIRGHLTTGEAIVLQTYPVDEHIDALHFEIVRAADTPHFAMIGNIPSAYYQKPDESGVLAVRD